MKQLGIEGYAIYFMLLEVLRDQTDLCYPMEDIDLLADEFGTSEQKVRTIICNYQLFDVDDEDQFFSPKFNEYLAPYLEQKEVNRINGIKGNLIRHGKASKDEIAKMTNEQILALNSKESRFLGGDSGGDRVAVAKKEKKSKVNQSKGKESNIYTFDSFWDAYDKKIDRKKCEAKWNRLPVKDKEAILQFIPIYQAHQPDEKYRKNPYTFLNSEIWTEDWNNYQPKSENNDSSNDFYQQLSELERINEVQRHNDQEGASPVNIYQLRGR